MTSHPPSRLLRLRLRGLAAIGAGLPAALLVAGPAWAHGISGEATGRGALGYVPLGIKHMLTGWDHLLFVLAVILLAGQVHRAAKLLSLFVLGHSTTLAIGTLQEWKVDPTVVDVLIAASVICVALIGLRGRPKDWTWVGAVVFGFGLIHGLGLATRLQDLGIPDDGLLVKILAFNVGLEIGQLTAACLMVGAVLLVVRAVKDVDRARRVAYLGLTLVGMVLVLVLITPGTERKPVAIASATASCERGPFTGTLTPAGTHPGQRFSEPGDPVVEEDLQHVMGDGYVVVRYRADLPVDRLAQLRFWTEGLKPDAPVVVAPAEQVQDLAVASRTRVVTCGTYDQAVLQSTLDQHLDEVLAVRPNRPASGARTPSATALA